jgi:hypothetical protein
VSVAPAIAWFLVTGQSNARGSAEDNPYYLGTADHVWVWDLGAQTIRVLKDPYANTSMASGRPSASSASFARGSFAPRLADYLRANGYDSVGFIHVTEGGENSSQFVQSMDLYTNAVANVQAALAASPIGSRLAGIIQYQGESDAAQATGGALYISNWTDYFDGLDTDLDGTTGVTVPINKLIIELPVTMPTNGAYDLTNWNAIRSAQVTLASNLDADIIQAPDAAEDLGVHQGIGADDTEGHRKIAVDAGSVIVAGGW